MKKISILVDHKSWIIKYARLLFQEIKNLNYPVSLARKHSEVKKGDILFILGCKNLLNKSVLIKNKFNLVIHESNLPKGKGMNPVSNQILKNKKKIICSMFNATQKMDSGPIVLKDSFKVKRDDFYEDWRFKQGMTTVKMCLKFLSLKRIVLKKQKGKPTFFKKLNNKMFEINVNSSIKKQHQILQAADFKKFVPFFKIKKKIFYIKK